MDTRFSASALTTYAAMGFAAVLIGLATGALMHGHADAGTILSLGYHGCF